MRLPNAWWSLIASAIVGLGISGCGGASDDEKEFEAANNAAPESSSAEPAAPEEPAPPPVARVAAAPVPVPQTETPKSENTGVAGASASSEGGTPIDSATPSAPSGGLALPSRNPAGGAKPSTAAGAAEAIASSSGRAEGEGAAPAMPSRGGGAIASSENSGAVSAAPGGYPGPSSSSETPAGNSGSSGSSATPSNYPGANSSPGTSSVEGAQVTPGGGAGTPGGGAAGNFSNAVKGAQSFLDALQAKDAQLLAEATAKRAEYESSAAHREDFKAILSQTFDSSGLDKLARDFEGMKVMDYNTRKSSGVIEVIVGKEDTRTYNLATRHLVMRREKDGWKVMDYTGLRETNPAKKGRRR